MNSWAVCLAMIGVDSASQKGTETPHCVISVHLDLLQEINFQKKKLTKNRPPKKGWEDDLSENWSLVVFFGGSLQTGCLSTRGTQNPDIGFPFEITDVNGVPDIWDHGLFFHPQANHLVDGPKYSEGSHPGPSAKRQFLGEVWNVGQLEAFEAFCMTQIQLGEGNSCKARRQKLFTPED